MMQFEKHKLVDLEPVQSLVRAEWGVVRTAQSLVSEDWAARLKVSRFDDKCCGILFYNGYAFACNGHWIMRTIVDYTSVDPEVSMFFYDYLRDEVLENYNPFEEIYGITLDAMFKILNDGRTIRPAHSMYDGDTIFAMATGKVGADVNVVGLLAARVMEQAVINAVKASSSLCGFKCYSDLNSEK
jgi:hypothetical protein